MRRRHRRRGGPSGLFVVGNGTLDADLKAWLDERHVSLPCSYHDTAVYFAPTSPNGIGNKLLALTMSFHMALMQRRALVVTDWPPATMPTSCTRRLARRPSGEPPWTRHRALLGTRSRNSCGRRRVSGSSRRTSAAALPSASAQSPPVLSRRRRAFGRPSRSLTGRTADAAHRRCGGRLS